MISVCRVSSVVHALVCVQAKGRKGAPRADLSEDEKQVRSPLNLDLCTTVVL